MMVRGSMTVYTEALLWELTAMAWNVGVGAAIPVAEQGAFCS